MARPRKESIADESVVNIENNLIFDDELESIADESVVNIEVIQDSKYLKVGELHVVSGDIAKNLIKKGIVKIKN